MHTQLLSFLVRSLPPKARNTLPTQSTAQDHFDRNLGKERDVLDRVFMPGYTGYRPRGLQAKTDGGQWIKPEFLEVDKGRSAIRNDEDRKAMSEKYAAQPPGCTKSVDGFFRPYQPGGGSPA